MKKRFSEKENLVFEEFKRKYERSRSAYSSKLKRMDFYENLLSGTKKIENAKGKKASDATYVRNIVYELIEAQVDSTIPQPKVSALKEKYEENARKLENKLRNDLEKFDFEVMNDAQERITPTQGGSFIWVEWDNFKRTHNTVGDFDIRILHPKQFIPQEGVYEIEEMDYFFILLSQTNEYIMQRYGIDVAGETEEEPGIRGTSESAAEDKVTQIISYFRNREGNIGKISWVGNTLLEYMEDYQARKLRRCKKCSEVCIDKQCVCGSKSFMLVSEDYETLREDLALRETVGEDGFMSPELVLPKGTKIKYYKPNIYPVVRRRNTSKFGSFLGESDVEIVKDMQNTLKKIDSDTEEKLLTGGSYFYMPKGKNIRTTDENFKVVEIENPAERDLIGAVTAQADVSRNNEYADRMYQQARNLLGITDSFQGRRDPTATSGTAKEFAARQTAGRLESKKIMKNAAFSKLFEIMAKFYIAFADEPRSVITQNDRGKPVFEEISKYDFIDIDEAGEYYYNVEYLFGIDPSGSLASSREAMWQETRMNFQNGCFGDPAGSDAQLMFWTIMETLHYPSAAKIKAHIEQKVEEEKRQIKIQQEQAQAVMQQEQILAQQIQGQGESLR